MTFTKDPSTHPANGPLTEERLIRVRDELAAAAKRSDGGNLGYMMDDAAKAIDELLALRKVEHEPIYQLMNYDWYDADKSIYEEVVNAGGTGRIVYAAPQLPQPVMDSNFLPKNLDRALGVLGMALPESREEFNLQQERWIQRLIDRVIRCADELVPQPAVPESPPEHLLPQGNSRDACYRRGAIINGWKLCRAAMLQGAEPVSQPYTLRDGWVAVPVEPTAEMLGSVSGRYMTPIECWHNMIAAAPQQDAE